MAISTEDVFNAIGFIGGVILAVALLPQIYLAHKRKSTKDISYMWQAIYTTGLATLMAYYAYFELWPVFYPMAFELACLFYLTLLKTYYEKMIKQPTTGEPEDVDDSRNGRLQRV